MSTTKFNKFGSLMAVSLSMASQYLEGTIEEIANCTDGEHKEELKFVVNELNKPEYAPETDLSGKDEYVKITESINYGDMISLVTGSEESMLKIYREFSDAEFNIRTQLNDKESLFVDEFPEDLKSRKDIELEKLKNLRNEKIKDALADFMESRSEEVEKLFKTVNQFRHFMGRKDLKEVFSDSEVLFQVLEAALCDERIESHLESLSNIKDLPIEMKTVIAGLRAVI